MASRPRQATRAAISAFLIVPTNTAGSEGSGLIGRNTQVSPALTDGFRIAYFIAAGCVLAAALLTIVLLPSAGRPATLKLRLRLPLATLVVIGIFLASEPRLYDRGIAWMLPLRARSSFYRIAEHAGFTLRRLDHAALAVTGTTLANRSGAGRVSRTIVVLECRPRWRARRAPTTPRTPSSCWR